MTRAGFVALLGATNAGKSTLLNRLVGAKCSIVTHKAQTTRSAIRGIAMHGDSQIIFIDTPGIFQQSPHHAQNRLSRAMLDTAWQNAQDCDMALVVHDAAQKSLDPHTRAIAKTLQDKAIKKALVLNKIDLTPRPKLLARTKQLTDDFSFTRVFMVSATKADGTSDICPWLAGEMPTSPYLYDPEDLTDLPSRLMAAEILREQLFLHLHDELPYQLTVETEHWQKRDDGSIEIHAQIITAKQQHRAMIIGAGGQQLARIGTAARTEMEAVFGGRIHLLTHIKVGHKWFDDPARYTPWGLNYHA